MTISSPLSDPTIVHDPYPAYSALADRDPVHWCERMNAWAIMRYADCANVLRDARFKAERMENVLSAKFAGRSLPVDNIYHRFTKNVMMYTDPPRHTALRRSTQPAFSREAHEHYSQVIKDVATDLIATIPQGTREIDAVPVLAAQLPVNAAVRAFGVPEEDLEFVLPRVETIMTYWSGPQEQPVELDFLLGQLDDLHVYSVELLQGARGKVLPGTVIHRLATNQSQSDESECSPEQTIHQLVLLLIALFAPTTPGSTSSGLLSFAVNPSQVERFLTNHECVENVANEVVRYNASNQFTWRLAAEALEISDVKIEEGQNVAVFLGAANRDPRMFSRPDDFDLGRHNSSKHLSFGAGLHSCLGRQIASLELKWFFVALFARFQNIDLAGEPVWNTNLEFRSLRSLPLALG